jgi:membrane protease YdiL (CAAX protease family)
MILFFGFTIGIELCIFRDLAGIFPQGTFAPTLAYLLFILFFRKMAVPIVLDINKTVLTKLVQAVIIPVVIAFLAFIAGNVFGMNIVLDNVAQIGGSLMPVILIIIVGGIGEEIGWRSFLKTTLERKCSVLASSIIVGIMWGLWHIDRWNLGIIFMSLMVLQTVSFSIIMALILKDTNNNIILSTALHASFNTGFQIFFGMRFTETKILLLIAATMLVIAIIMVIINRKYYLQQKNVA